MMKINNITILITAITVFIVLAFTISVASTVNVIAQDVCSGDTVLIVDEAGVVQCRDSLGNVCAPEALVEGNNPNTMRCTTVGSGTTTGFVPPPSVSGNASCQGVDLAVDVNCDESTGNPITGYINGIINFLAGAVGLVVIIMVATGGVQYMMAGGNPQATQAALKRITDAIIGLLFFIFLYAFLQWVVPGGLFNSSSSSDSTPTSSQRET